jgi:6-phosphofructokinase 1
LACEKAGDAPHIILFPEIVFDQAKFLEKVRASVARYGYCVVVVSEGLHDATGRFLAEAGGTDAFGHAQLGGVGPLVAKIVKDALGLKFHWAVADYLQRASRHIASKVDVEQAYAVGAAAVKFAVAGKDGILPIIVRKSDRPYRWSIGEAPLSAVANAEKKVPRNFITADGFGITAAARRYLAPLIAGEDYPPYANGLPVYVQLKALAVRKRLRTTFVL